MSPHTYWGHSRVNPGVARNPCSESLARHSERYSHPASVYPRQFDDFFRHRRCIPGPCRNLMLRKAIEWFPLHQERTHLLYWVRPRHKRTRFPCSLRRAAVDGVHLR